MHKKEKPPGLTRRQVLAGAATAALAASSASVFAMPRVAAKPRAPVQRNAKSSMPLRRYMAASTLLSDGRILVSGGYDRPWTDNNPPVPLRSAVIYDPSAGTQVTVAPMSSPRARHAAATLGDGRVVVVGGFGTLPLSAVEIYDPTTNTWTQGEPLGQPRFDHNAVADGSRVIVIGGSGTAVLSTVETLQF